MSGLTSQEGLCTMECRIYHIQDATFKAGT